MKRRLDSDMGFTLVELMTVILVIAVLVTIVVPLYANARKLAELRACAATRTVVERSDHAFYVANARRPASVADLVGTYIKSTPVCPAGGVYAWVDQADPTAPARTLGCSVHYFPTAPLSPLGSSFSEISTNLMTLMAKYYAAHGHWPSKKTSYADLGLVAADWTKPIEHLYFSTSGSRISIRPEKDYVITVKRPNGKTVTLTSKDDHSLLYSATDKAWYYDEIDHDKVITISSMVVKPK
ncbi:MAG: prepilin-type N-terminal cleavage/methylation domain-containing protein [Coriobacteriia bacterium]|nr:prepilin-type N-terminal cleavage/methylation domain-containing protein [Coriobacteriia bacterium]